LWGCVCGAVFVGRQFCGWDVCYTLSETVPCFNVSEMGLNWFNQHGLGMELK